MGKSCSDFFPGSEGFGGHLFLPPSFRGIFRFRDGMCVLGADVLEGR